MIAMSFNVIVEGLNYYFDATNTRARVKRYFWVELANFLRHALITQDEKLVFSFLVCLSICSISSWGNRIFFFADLLLMLSLTIARKSFIRLLCLHNIIKCTNKKVLTYVRTPKYTGCTDKSNTTYLNTAMPQSAETLLRHLTNNIKDTNAMANSNDTLHPENAQQPFSNLFSVLNQYHATISPDNLIHAKSHFEALHVSIIAGMGAMGNLMYWATESESYEFEPLKNDIRDIGYLLIHLRDIAYFASNEINQMNAQFRHGKGDSPCL